MHSNNLRNHLLACPNCKSLISLDFLECIKCQRKLTAIKDALSSFEALTSSYFDDKHEVMTETTNDSGTFDIFYKEQIKFFEKNVPRGATVLDVGCGPAVPYKRSVDWFLIGVEPSLDSILSNSSLDLKLHSTSEAIPVSDRAVDVIVCFYSIHHMTGSKLEDNHIIVRNTFLEFQRIIRHGGQLFIFDISPIFPFDILEKRMWSIARKMLGQKLDMFFWKDAWLRNLGREIFPDATLKVQSYSGKLLTTFSPIFYLPKLRMPRVMYPFAINLYHWTF